MPGRNKVQNYYLESALDVMAPYGRDVHQDFSGGVPSPDASGHPPVSFHGMAAATGGAFHRDPSTVGCDRRTVLVLIPNRFQRALAAVELLRSRGHTVLAAWKECGRHQLEIAWNRPGYCETMERIGKAVTAWISPSPATLEFLASRMPCVRVIELPTPYPVHMPGWQFCSPDIGLRRGVFIGTREWRVSSRRHGEALRLASRLASENPGIPLTVVNPDGVYGWFRTRRVCGRTVTLLRPMGYHDYLRCMARHRVVLQRDESGVPGQVAGDALLAGIPCLGGDGMIDRLAFPHLPGSSADEEEVLECATGLLHDDDTWSAAVETARENAVRLVSFRAFRELWAQAKCSLS